MASKKKRVGIFDHAKYSQPILRQVSSSLYKTVNHDIAGLLKGNLVRAPNNSDEIHKAPFNKRKIDKPLLQSPKPPKEDFLFTPSFETTPRRKRNLSVIHHQEYKKNDNMKKFPEVPPLEQISESIMESFPHLTLRDGEPTEYHFLAYSLAKNALYSGLTREKENISTNKSKKSDEPLICNINNDFLTKEKFSVTDKDVFKTFADQTMFWNFDKDLNDGSNNNLRSRSALEECEESPTMDLDNFDKSFNQSLLWNFEKDPSFDDQNLSSRFTIDGYDESPTIETEYSEKSFSFF